MKWLRRIARMLSGGLGGAIVAYSVAWAADGIPQITASQAALSALPPPGNLSPAKVTLGERLFHDPVLSGREKLSCSACHDLNTGGTVRLRRTIGYDGQVHAFNAPTIFNVGNNYRLGWRGRFTSLAVQNEAVLKDPGLMAANWTKLLSRLTDDPSYLAVFRQIYGVPPSRETVLDALVTFQMSLATPNAPFDRFLMGDKGALTPVEKEGYRLFVEYGCVSCHQGANIGGNMFQIFGVFGSPDAEDMSMPSDLDKRLQASDGDESVFRVPSLRNVEVTAPYFHDGSAATLRDAIAIMGRSQLGRKLPQSDITNLEAFLKSLTGEYNGKRLSAVVTETVR
jgi:cytochrome c peroxidase